MYVVVLNFFSLFVVSTGAFPATCVLLVHVLPVHVQARPLSNEIFGYPDADVVVFVPGRMPQVRVEAMLAKLLVHRSMRLAEHPAQLVGVVVEHI